MTTDGQRRGLRQEGYALMNVSCSSAIVTIHRNMNATEVILFREQCWNIVARDWLSPKTHFILLRVIICERNFEASFLINNDNMHV